MMSENKDTEPIANSRIERSDSNASTSSTRSYSQRFSIAASQPYLVPDERLLQLQDRKLLMDIMHDDLVNVSWLLGITPKSTPIVDKASCILRSIACTPCILFTRVVTVGTCFISNSCPGAVSRFTHEHCTDDLLAYIRTQVHKRKIIAPVVAAAVYYAMLIRPPSFIYAADTESLILEKVELVLQEGREAGVNVDDVMRKMNERLVDQHFMSPPSREKMSRVGSV